MADTTTTMKYIAAIVSGVVLALQGVNIHTTGEVKNEAARVESEQSADLQSIQGLQKVQSEALADIKDLQAKSHVAYQRQIEIAESVFKGQKVSLERLGRIEQKLGIEEPSPTPQ